MWHCSRRRSCCLHQAACGCLILDAAAVHQCHITWHVRPHSVHSLLRRSSRHATAATWCSVRCLVQAGCCSYQLLLLHAGWQQLLQYCWRDCYLIDWLPCWWCISAVHTAHMRGRNSTAPVAGLQRQGISDASCGRGAVALSQDFKVYFVGSIAASQCGSQMAIAPHLLTGQ